MMSLLEAAESVGLAAVAVLVMRILLTPLLLYNLRWSFGGFRQLLKGVVFPTSLYQTVVFMFSGAVLGYNILAFFGRTVSTWSLPWSLAFQCMILLGSVAAFVGRRLAVSLNFENFYWLFSSGNLDLAVRVAEMNEADPEFTEGAVAAAEQTLALQLAKKAINGSPN